MGLPLYLALTAAEMANAECLPEQNAYMACHFSPYSTGLSNFPESIPAGSILIVNDRTPAHGHDPLLITQQLMQAAQQLQISAVLLDLQRENQPLSAAVVETVTEKLSCPVGVSDIYAKGLSCPVFLSAPPPHILLKDYVAPWQGREIWLEAALETETITLTEKGSIITPVPHTELSAPVHQNGRLHCHYCTKVFSDQVIFTLQRTKEDLFALLEEAETLGVRKAVGLYQQLG